MIVNSVKQYIVFENTRVQGKIHVKITRFKFFLQFDVYNVIINYSYVFVYVLGSFQNYMINTICNRQNNRKMIK